MILRKSHSVSLLCLSVALMMGLQSCSLSLKKQAGQEPLVMSQKMPQAKHRRPDPVSMLPVPWSIKKIDDSALFCTGADGYENLAKNMQRILRYMRQSNSLIEAYEKD